MSERQGYLILASGPVRYVEMAANLAASIKVMDPSRRICLIHDSDSLPKEVSVYFDEFAKLSPDDRYPGFMNKLRLFHLAPYDRSMLIDADCLMMKRDIGRFWQQASQTFFYITGDVRTRGEWKGADIAELLKQEGAPYLVQMNSGVFCFDKTSRSKEFFEGLNDFYIRRMDHLGVGLHRGKLAQTDEIYIGLWMGINGLEGGGQAATDWMISTWRGFGMRFDGKREVSLIRKPVRSTMGIPNPILGWRLRSPTIAHFVGLRPRTTYERQSRWFRKEALARLG